MRYVLILLRLQERRWVWRVRWPVTILLTLIFGLNVVHATDFVIHLPDASLISRQSVTYRCDASGPKIGVPSKPFQVEYINGGGNSLAIVPILGNSLIFSNVSSASGAQYTTQQYIWWEAKGAATLYSNSINGKLQSSCHIVLLRKQVRPNS